MQQVLAQGSLRARRDRHRSILPAPPRLPRKLSQLQCPERGVHRYGAKVDLVISSNAGGTGYFQGPWDGCVQRRDESSLGSRRRFGDVATSDEVLVARSVLRTVFPHDGTPVGSDRDFRSSSRTKVDFRVFP